MALSTTEVGVQCSPSVAEGKSRGKSVLARSSPTDFFVPPTGARGIDTRSFGAVTDSNMCSKRTRSCQTSPDEAPKGAAQSDLRGSEKHGVAAAPCFQRLPIRRNRSKWKPRPTPLPYLRRHRHVPRRRRQRPPPQPARSLLLVSQLDELLPLVATSTTTRKKLLIFPRSGRSAAGSGVVISAEGAPRPS